MAKDQCQVQSDYDLSCDANFASGGEREKDGLPRVIIRGIQSNVQSVSCPNREKEEEKERKRLIRISQEDREKGSFVR